MGRATVVVGLVIAALLGSEVSAEAPAVAGAHRSAAAPRFVLGPGGVRRIRVGRSFGYLRARGLVGPLRAGCELAGPGGDLSAAIRGGLKGSVSFHRNHRAYSVIVVRGAQTARGVRVGDTLARVRRLYPGARFHLDPVFGVYFVEIKRPRGVFTITIDGGRRRVDSLSAPVPPICE